MRELESSLQSFGEFLLEAQLVRPTAAPYVVRWVRRFLSRPASDEPLTGQVRGFCEELERNGGFEDWQVRQADQALRLYFVNFLKRTAWHRRPASTVVDEDGCTNRLAALAQLRTRLKTRHYSYRTECTYVDWVRRFIDYAAEQQGIPHPRVAAEVVRDCLAHLAVRRQVSASTQNQALCALSRWRLPFRSVCGVTSRHHRSVDRFGSQRHASAAPLSAVTERRRLQALVRWLFLQDLLEFRLSGLQRR